MLMRHRQIKSGRLNRPQSKDTGALSAPAGQHAAAAGVATSFEGPRRHDLVTTPMWRDAFGSLDDPKPPWRIAFPDGCMYGARSPDEVPLAVNKRYLVVADFALPLMQLQCRDGLVRPLQRGVRDHVRLVGSIGSDSRGLSAKTSEHSKVTMTQ